MKSLFTFLLSFLIFNFCDAQIVEKPHVSMEDSVEKIFSIVEKEAEYPGGFDAWKKYLSKKLKSDIAVKNDAPSGFYRVMIRFVVNKDGSISDVKAISKCGYGMEEEAIRVIKSGSKWIAAEQNGKKVNAYHHQPITFVVAK